MIVYPENHWYGEVTEEKIDEVLNGLPDGTPAEGQLVD
jgi:(2Fe-2S) ferredoxin